MLRTQIQLTPQQAAFLKARAADAGVSMAELIRQYIDGAQRATLIPAASTRRQRAGLIAGQFRSGTGDMSENHDAYLAQAYAK